MDRKPAQFGDSAISWQNQRAVLGARRVENERKRIISNRNALRLFIN